MMQSLLDLARKTEICREPQGPATTNHHARGPDVRCSPWNAVVPRLPD